MNVPRFEIAGGSVAGSAHVAAGRNNQDAFAWAETPAGTIAVVCDGCSGAPHSDVGAGVVARLMVQSASRWLGTGLEVPRVLERVREDVLAHLRVLASAMSAEVRCGRGPGAMVSFQKTVADYFLCTVVGVVVDARVATTFSLGDGIIVVNGQHERLGPFADNEPPYLGYELLGVVRREFEIHRVTESTKVDSIVLGTDGANDLGSAAERFLEERVFRNPDMIRRRLTVIRRELRDRLADDTTLVVMRRAKEVA